MATILIKFTVWYAKKLTFIKSKRVPEMRYVTEFFFPTRIAFWPERKKRLRKKNQIAKISHVQRSLYFTFNSVFASEKLSWQPQYWEKYETDHKQYAAVSRWNIDQITEIEEVMWSAKPNGKHLSINAKVFCFTNVALELREYVDPDEPFDCL